MKVFWQDTDTGEVLPVSVDGSEGKVVQAPAFIHHSQAWADQLRMMWYAKHVQPHCGADHPTLIATCPTVIHGENEMLCGDQRFYQTPE